MPSHLIKTRTQTCLPSLWRPSSCSRTHCGRPSNCLISSPIFTLIMVASFLGSIHSEPRLATFEPAPHGTLGLSRFVAPPLFHVFRRRTTIGIHKPNLFVSSSCEGAF